ncbi:hypothetical protein SCHPADRAFT_831771 [Schizopora paradoxa]|uniref:CxC2-like cysteine cluster KDZ transposase-associated domain-containing protein n=1 Tax=Schizopora paradoxa TaxID=27342 RepID=A0A0H2RGL1_9AGAM|nr:hypothetical protein SCHPADRAFT_831771 [Schizopora paradoxa]
MDILQQWTAKRNVCLDELHRLDGFIGNSEDFTCSRSNCLRDGVIRCTDCLPTEYYCDSCCVAMHALQPFHRVERWNGKFWTKTSLSRLGLVVHVGHGDGVCPSPVCVTRDVQVIDSNGIFVLKVRFCNCPLAGSGGAHFLQLLRIRWFPCTIKTPSSAVTFRCLDTVCRLNNQGKLTGYDYYQSLMQGMDSAEIDPPKKRYDEFMRMIRVWKHLMLLKRGGIGMLPGDVNSASRGSCAVECPACPRELPTFEPASGSTDPDDGDGDENNNDPPPPLVEWLDTEFVMLDANFRLKLKQRNLVDPPLGGGLAYFVEQTPYMSHVKSAGTQTEINVCDSGLHAIDHANTRGGSAYAASGVGACQCRHMLVKSLGVGDLQKGEKYSNMDFIFSSAIRDITAKRLVVSYDIACQWHKKLRGRLANMNPAYSPDIDSRVVDFVIPKFHIGAHGSSCQTRFSLNYRPHMGRTDGENIERGWAWLNPASLSTREMGPGARQDALDDQWSFWNWRIVVSLGNALGRRFEDAVYYAREQRLSHTQFTATFKNSQVARWNSMVQDWYADADAFDPFQEPENVVSVSQVRQELAKEEENELSLGVMPLHEVSLSQFLVNGLELEEAQRSLRVQIEAKKANKLTVQSVSLDEKEVALRRKITIWFAIQRIYMPCIDNVRPAARNETQQDEGATDTMSAVDMELYLPERLDPEQRSQVDMKVISKYRRLRLAQADDALSSMKRHLRKGSTLFLHKQQHTAGTGQTKTMLDADRYRAARAALIIICPNGKWKKRLRVLKEKHVRPPLREQGASEGRRKLTWIWLMRPALDDELEAGDDGEEDEEEVNLRVEWAKSLARAERWEEEVRLLKVEMSRTLLFLQYKSFWWLERARERTDVPPEVQSGILAYAHKQAALSHQIAEKFASHWLTLFAENKTKPPASWPSKYRVIRMTTTQIVRRRKRQQAFIHIQRGESTTEDGEMEVDT